MPALIVGVNEHVTLLHATQRSLEEGLTVHGLAHNQLGAAPGETAIVVGPGEGSILVLCRDFHCLAAGSYVLHLKNSAPRAANVGACSDADALLADAPEPGRSIRTRSTMPGASRRNWTSKISRPNDAATRLAMSTHLTDNVRRRHLFAA
jgi:hypothetical protein